MMKVSKSQLKRIAENYETHHLFGKVYYVRPCPRFLQRLVLCKLLIVDDEVNNG